jgi:anti-anti-sigma factor
LLKPDKSEKARDPSRGGADAPSFRPRAYAAHDALRVEVHPEGDRVRVAAVGELDIATSPGLEDKLRELQQGGVDRVLLDLRRLTFIDCAGLRSLLRAQANGLEARSRLHVLCQPGRVTWLLALTGVDQQLDIIAAEDGAGSVDGSPG